MIKCLQFKRRNEPRRGDYQNLHPDPKIARLAWNPRFKIQNLWKIPKYWTPTQDPLRCKGHKKSSSESLILRNILKYWIQNARLNGALCSTNRRRLKQIKDAEVIQSASYLSTQKPHLKIKHGLKPALAVHIQKGFKS